MSGTRNHTSSAARVLTMGVSDGWMVFGRLRSVFGLSVAELATLLQVTEPVLRRWVRAGVPSDVRRVVAEYEHIGALLAGAAHPQSPPSVPRFVRMPLDGLGGSSILDALAAGERELVRQFVTGLSAADDRTCC